MDALHTLWTELAAHLFVFTLFDYFVLLFNAVIFALARVIVRKSGLSVEEKSFNTNVRLLRLVNLTLFILYFLAGLFSEYARPLSITGLTLLVAFLSGHLLQTQALRRFGRVKEIDSERFRTHTYQSEVVGLLIWLFALIVSFVVIINAWDVTSWLQATSALGAILVIIYATKDVWAPDNINGLFLLYNSDIEPGAVIAIKELDLLAIALRITLTQVVLRDLRRKYKILIPNSRFRNTKIEVLSATPSAGLDCYVDFNLGYGIPSEHVKAFLHEVWEVASQRENCFADGRPRVRLLANGDHAVTWRLIYTVKNAYRMIEAEYAINRAAYDLSLERGIGLNTPLTHVVETQARTGDAQEAAAITQSAPVAEVV